MKEGSLLQSLSKDQKTLVLELMDHPAWGLLTEINQGMRDNWLEQVVSTDYSSKSDEEVMRTLRYRQGLINGVTVFLKKLEKEKNTKFVQ